MLLCHVMINIIYLVLVALATDFFLERHSKREREQRVQKCVIRKYYRSIECVLKIQSTRMKKKLCGGCLFSSVKFYAFFFFQIYNSSLYVDINFFFLREIIRQIFFLRYFFIYKKECLQVTLCDC